MHLETAAYLSILKKTPELELINCLSLPGEDLSLTISERRDFILPFQRSPGKQIPNFPSGKPRPTSGLVLRALQKITILFHGFLSTGYLSILIIRPTLSHNLISPKCLFIRFEFQSGKIP